MYQEHRVAGLPAVVWQLRGTGQVKAVIPDGCMDLVLIGDRILVAGPDLETHHVRLAADERCLR